jgi:arylsulfatase A-like enzyme
MSQITSESRPRETVAFRLILLLRSVFLRAPDTSSEPASPAGVAATRARAEMLSLVLVVCAAIIAVKGFIAYRDLDSAAAPPQVCDDSLAASLARVAACCAEDLAVGLACFLLAVAALRWVTSSRGRLVLRVAAHLAAGLALAYMVVNAQIFHVVRHYLTFTLVRLAGGFHPDRSVYAHATTPFRLALALVPLIALAAHLWGVRTFPRLWRAAAAHAARPTLVLCGFLALGALLLAQSRLVGGPSDYPRNPHLYFVRSFFNSPALPAADADESAGEEDDEADFRPGQPGHTPGLLAKPPRNVIVITGESVAACRLQTYGCPMPTTPNLVRLDAEGKSLTFENFYATCNHTIAACLPIFGGMYNDPATLATVVDHPDFPLPGAPAWLRKQGYTTCFFAAGGGSSWEGYRGMAKTFAVKGFDVSRDPNHPFWQSQPRPAAFLDEDRSDEATFADLRRAVREFRDRKFAMWLWTGDTHSPYYDGRGPRTFPREYFPAAVADGGERENGFQTYLRAVWRLDWLVGELYRDLEELGLADDTLIVLTGDHGEEFGEHGWFGHNWSTFEAEVRVPGVFICPRLAPLGRRSPVVGSHADLWATITDVCGLPADPDWQGRSLVSRPQNHRAYFYRAAGDLGVRDGKYKYVWNYADQRELLFDVESDPLERDDLAAENPDYCARQQRRVKAWAAYQGRLTKERLGRAGE